MPQIVYPVRVKISSKGDIFVLDERSRKVACLNGEGAFLRYVELGGAPTESMIVPADIALDNDDNLYVLDVGNGRVLVFGADGKFQRQIEFPKEYGFIIGMAVDQKVRLSKQQRLGRYIPMPHTLRPFTYIIVVKGRFEIFRDHHLEYRYDLYQRPK